MIQVTPSQVMDLLSELFILACVPLNLFQPEWSSRCSKKKFRDSNHPVQLLPFYDFGII